jgi:CheY-like chemotaxis protein
MNGNGNNLRTILLVDDDEEDRLLLLEALKEIGDGCHVVEAVDGADALARLKEFIHNKTELPCLIILDINMPRMNGRETFKAIRQNEKTASIPIVVFSSASEEHDQAHFGTDNTTYIRKPVHFRELVDIARRLLKYCEH